jgi:hypothetical protein
MCKNRGKKGKNQGVNVLKSGCFVQVFCTSVQKLKFYLTNFTHQTTAKIDTLRHYLLFVTYIISEKLLKSTIKNKNIKFTFFHSFSENTVKNAVIS